MRVDGRPAEVVAFEGALVGFFVEAAEILGVPKSVAAIYAICFASPEPLSFSEINDRLEISSGSISQGLRVLKDVGALKIVQVSTSFERPNGDLGRNFGNDSVKLALARSRDRYEPDLELRKIATHFFEHHLAKQLHSGRSRLKVVAGMVPGNVDGSAKILRGRVKALQTWHDKTRALLPIAKAFLRLT